MGIAGKAGWMMRLNNPTLRVMTLLLALAATGCQDKRIVALEQRVNRLEQRIQQLEAENKTHASDEAARQAKLESCISDANAEFQRNVVSNGTRTRNGSYNVPVPLLAEMQRQKQSKIEECRLLYSK